MRGCRWRTPCCIGEGWELEIVGWDTLPRSCERRGNQRRAVAGQDTLLHRCEERPWNCVELHPRKCLLHSEIGRSRRCLHLIHLAPLKKCKYITVFQISGGARWVSVFCNAKILKFFKILTGSREPEILHYNSEIVCHQHHILHLHRVPLGVSTEFMSLASIQWTRMLCTRASRFVNISSWSACHILR